MVLWICLGVVVLGLVALGMLALDLKGRADRLQAALTLAQQQTTPAVEVVRGLADIPKPNLTLAKPRRTLIGVPDEREGSP